ncbi:MAG: two-component regulator propeller domain-containing protein [Bacteroidota bacterium]
MIVDTSAQEGWDFREITVDDGLSANNVRYIYKDSYGFIWVGTSNGLNRYDGYEFKVYNHIPGDTTTISSGTITAITEDENGDLWIGTTNGLNIFIRKKGIFRSFLHDPNDTGSISSSKITCLLKDKKNNLWIGTHLGINKITKTKKNYHFKKFFPETKKGNRMPENEISFLFEDSKSRIWTAIRGHGLIQFIPESGEYIHYYHDATNPFSISGNNIDCIEESERGELWLYDRYSGVNKFIPETGMFYHYGNSPKMKKVLEPMDRVLSIERDREGKLWFGTINTFYVYNHQENKIIYSGIKNVIPDYKPVKDQAIYIYEDPTGIVWIAYGDVGIDIYDPNQDKFSKWYTFLKTDDKYRDYITSMIFLSEDDIWFGTWEGGLLHTNIRGEIYKRYINTSTLPELSSNNIIAITRDNKGKIWIGTENGLNVFDPLAEKIITHYFHDPKDANSLKNSYIIKLYRDNHDLIWIITEEGLNVINPVTGAFVRNSIQDFPELIKTRDIYHDEENNYWFATEDGVVKYSTSKKKIETFCTDLTDKKSICSNHVTDIFLDSRGFYWFGTKNGISRFDKSSGVFKSYFEKDGLLSNEILMTQEDEKGNIWTLTSLGISTFDAQNETFVNYDKKDGLRRKSFYLYKCYDDEFVITNERGFYKFEPQDIKSNQHIPPVVFTDFYLNGKAIPEGTRPLDNGSLLHTSKIVLKYNERSFGIRFSALNYTSTEKNQYAYMLDDYHEEWQPLGTRREIDLLNIKPGKYILRVIGSNNDNIWNNEGSSIDLIIKPPWWQTWWAFLFYGIIIFSILTAYRFFTIRSERIKNQMEFEKMKARKVHEIDEMKIAFFSNISHELRTPLTLMLAPLNNYLENPSKGLPHDKISLIHRSAERLHFLIDQLLDLRKIEVGKLYPKVAQSDLIRFITDILPSYESYAKQLKLDFKFQCNETEKFCYFDKDKTEKIISNLISNALKYTPEGGSINVSLDIRGRDYTSGILDKSESDTYIVDDENELSQGELFALFSVSDTGNGISNTELPRIFDRFYQSENIKFNFYNGSGIGLALTKDLVKILRGHIIVKSKVGKGSVFTIILPVDKFSFQINEITGHTVEPDNIISEQSYTETGVPEPSESQEPNNSVKKDRTVLIVEDNEELNNYLDEVLSGEYIIKTARNGAEGLQVALNENLDLILSDLMMPEMDGIEFCAKIKNDVRTSHIPFILLTARKSITSELKGLGSGADDYIIKPFNNSVLLMKIRNTLNLRQELRERFMNDLNIIPEGIKLTNRDEEFLKRIIEIVETDISNTELDKEQFYRKVGMSRTQVYRKLNSLTNQSVNEFIRNIRLKKAAEILKCSNNISIAELAYTVGFSNPNYFTRVFREHFGLTPTQYNNKHFQVNKC